MDDPASRELSLATPSARPQKHHQIVTKEQLEALQPTGKSATDSFVLTWDTSDHAYPRNWSSNRKWLIIGTTLLCTFSLPLNGTSITIAAAEINAEFNVSDVAFPHSYWPVTSWSIGGAVFLIFLLPLLEDLGVQIGYVTGYIFFYAMLIGQTVAQNFATLIITRFFSGGCVALLANTISSMIPDLWPTDKQRSLPVSIYVALYVIGSTFGPVVFGPIMQYNGNWRWIFYAQLILYGALFTPVLLVLRETRSDVILRRQAKKLSRSTGLHVVAEPDVTNEQLGQRLTKAVTRPFFLLFTEPVLFASTIWSAFSFGTVFLFTQSTAQVFSQLYGWQEYSIGYLQGAIVVGEALGWLCGLYGTRLYFQSAQRNSETPGESIPEARLYVAVPASFVGLAGGMLVYAWTSYPWIPWICPAIGLALVGLGIQVVVSAVADYVIDAYAASGYGGSAISAVAFGENVVAGFLPLAAQSLYTNLGFQWASTLLAFVALLLSLAPVVFVWKGRWFRERSPFMQSSGKADLLDSPRT